MKCGACLSEDTKVLESRLSHDGKSIRRRRICRRCQHRFTTHEREEQFIFHIKKKNGRIELYQREKALFSIQIACRKRCIKSEDLEFLLSKIENKIQDFGERIVSSQQLGNLIMEHLGQLDPVAYVRFASVYKDFQNPGQFYSILRSLR